MVDQYMMTAKYRFERLLQVRQLVTLAL